jgi:hypothetical protein
MINNDAPEAEVEAAYGWIKKAVDQDYAPAKEALELFAGRVNNP